MTNINLTEDQLKDQLYQDHLKKQKAMGDKYGAGAYLKPEPKDSDKTRAFSTVVSFPVVNPDGSFVEYTNEDGYKRIARDTDLPQIWADVYPNKDGSFSLRWTSVFDSSKKSTKTSTVKPQAPVKPVVVDDSDIPF
jgi:hypothetical protein|tara:strand:- start:12519 stop:12926 length:408 start_codon:yes stop_codon:yes gene_type:complete